jgi:DNA mismatch repair protein MutH
MTDQEILSDDWNKVLNYVKLGEAHLLSESISQVLAASRTGQGGYATDGTPRDQVNQPIVRYNAHAMKRAFSLKPSFTNQLYRERTSSASAFISLKEYVKGRSFKELLDNVLRGLNKYTDYSLHDFARVHDIELSNSKHRTARLIRAALGITKQSVTFREFVRYGISVKTVPVRFEDNKPWENVSFPHQPLKEILDEESFGDSMIAEWTRRILFIPLYRETRDEVDLNSIFIGKSFFWKPNHEQDILMENDYNNYRDTIRNGIFIEHVPWGNGFVRKNNLPKESSTSILHMRPHARDGNDFDYSLNDVRIVKQSFWLNGRFLKDLITAS